MTIRAPFKPHFGSNQVVTPAAASASITLAKGDKSVRLVNSGAAVCYFRVGIGAATTADCPVRTGESLVIEKPEDETAAAHISAAGTTLNVMTGEGGF